MVERFNGRIGTHIHGHADVEQLLAGFNQACNARRQRVLKAIRRTPSSPNG